MMSETEVYLLRILDGSRVLAEAKLEINEPELAWKVFSESFGDICAAIPGSFYKTMLVACDEEKRKHLPVQGLSAILIQRPSAIVVPTRAPNGTGQPR